MDNTPLRPCLLRVADAAAALGVSRSQLYVLLRRGDLRALKVGRATRLSTAELARFTADAKPAAFRPLPAHRAAGADR